MRPYIVISFIKKYLTNYCYFALILCSILSVCAQMIKLAQPSLSATILHELQKGQTVWNYAGILVLLFVLEGVLTASVAFLSQKMGEQITCAMRIDMVEHIFKKGVQELEYKKPDWYIQRMTQDSDIFKSMPEIYLKLLQSVVMLTGSFIAMTTINWVILLISTIMGCFAVIVSFAISAYTKKLSTLSREKTEYLASILRNAYQSNRLFRAYQIWDETKKGLISELIHIQKLNTRNSSIQSMAYPLTGTIMQVTNMGLLLIGAIGATQGWLSFHGLIAFLMYFSFFSSAIFQITSAFGHFKEEQVSISRIQHIICDCDKNRNHAQEDCLEGCLTEEEVTSLLAYPLCSERASIAFHHVFFKYKNAESQVLTDLSFEIPEKRLTAIVGESGGGKSTVVGLIERFFRPDNGYISFYGHPLSKINLNTWRSLISYIPQENLGVNGSLGYNISLSRKNCPKRKLKNLLKIVHLADYLEGLDMTLLDTGFNLSGGQLQKLALARALSRNTPFLLLDEPTSHLDGEAEEEYFHILKQLVSTKTVVYTSHRASMIERADWVIVIKNGTCIAQGTPSQLNQTCSYYSRLVNLQRTDTSPDSPCCN